MSYMQLNDTIVSAIVEICRANIRLGSTCREEISSLRRTDGYSLANEVQNMLVKRYPELQHME